MVLWLEPIFDILRSFVLLAEWLWDLVAFHPAIEAYPGVSLLGALIGVLYLKSRGSNDEREVSDSVVGGLIDVLVGVWVSLFDIVEALASILRGIGRAIRTGIERIRESENINLINVSIISGSILNVKRIIIAILVLVGIVSGVVFGGFNALF